MKIAFLHLGDLHLNDSSGAHPAKIQAIANTLAPCKPVDGIVIIVSGDIAAHGNANQYKIASTFLGRLVTLLKAEYSINEKNLKILIVPGNHDIDWSVSPRLTPAAIHAFSKEEKLAYLQQELRGMNNYFSFSDKNGCFFGSWMHIEFGQLVTRKILHFETGYRIEANLINTAPFSCDEDDGLHYLPEEAILSLSKPVEADLSLVVMHHSPDWFEFSQKKELERTIAQRCSLAFFGHEHYPGTQHVCYDNGGRIVKQAGGAWWQEATPTVSEYHVSIFDTETRKYSLSKCSWNPDRSTFLRTAPQEYTLMIKSLNGADLIYREDYISLLMEDSKNTISQSICDYFVFPSLRFNASKEYSKGKTVDKMGEFVDYIRENKYVAVVGGSSSGKTTLLKMLFKELYPHYTVLFCGTDDITGRNQENILKELVQNTYGEDAYSSFQCIPSEKKVIIIDDLHRISPKHLNKFLRGIEDLFGMIVVGTAETSQFDVVQMVKDNIKSNREFKKATISRLYADKRLALIKKIVLIKTGNDESRATVISRMLEQCLNSYKLTFRTEVDFVVQFVDYYCAHMGELDKSDATVFSKVFEASIEKSITPHLVGRRENANDIIIALSEVAHYIHFNREYPVTAEHINTVIQNYCEYYDNRYLTAHRFIEIATGSALLVSTSSGYEYRFASKNHLAYFVAKALNRKFHDTHNTADLEEVVRNSCFSINGDILMFMTYISDNVSIPRLLLDQAVSYVADWSEFDFRDSGIQYLKAMPASKLDAPDNNEKEQEVHKQALAEEEADGLIETLDIYDYDETQIDKLNNQLIRALLQLQIIARNFSAFVSILPGPVKKEYVSAMYQLPNRIFNQWAESVDNSFEHLVDEIIVWQEEPGYDGKKLSRENILHFFQEVSLNTLLNLYHTVSTFGANDNTVDYLAQQEYISSSPNYRIERLMFYEKVDDYQAVIREAEALHDEQDDGMAKNMVLSVMWHMVVHSDKIIDRERRRISSKYFPRQAQTKLLMERQKTQKEKGI